MYQVRFSKSGYQIDLTVTGMDGYGRLRVEGTIDGKRFRGTYGGDAVVFAESVKVGSTKIGGVRPVDAAKAELDRILAEMQAEQDAAAERYRTARFEQVHLVVGMDTDHVYVYPQDLEKPEIVPDHIENKLAKELEQRIDRLGLAALKAIAERGRRLEGRIGPKYEMTTDELEALLDELERPASEPEQPNQPAAAAEDEKDDRPVLRVKRCWECGRLDVVETPAGMSRAEAERILDEVTRRAIESAGEGPLAAVPRPIDAGLPVRIRVAFSWYCGC
jgi:hypothetical protein